jgi:3-oxoadipate enol-lactonase
MAFAGVNNLTLNYKVEGSSANPALVFVNSLGTDLRIWDDIVPYFAGRYSIIRYDKRGHGLSDCPAGPYTIADHTDDLAGILAYLGVKDRAIIIGISVGGMISLDFAARYPERVLRLILNDTGAVIGTPTYWEERISALEAHGFDELGEVILARWFAPTFAKRQPEAYQGYGNMLVRTPLGGYIDTCKAIRDADLRQAARHIDVPTLLMCGSEDQATPPELVRGLANMMSNAHFHIVPDAGHLPCIEQPEIMAREISSFLAHALEATDD